MPTPRRDSLHSGLVDTARSARSLEPRAAPRPRPPADAQEMGAKWTISYSRPAHLHIGGAAPPKRPPEKTGGLTYRSLPGFSSRQVLASILFPTAKRQEARPRDRRSTEPVGPSQPRAGAVRVPLVDRLPAAGLMPWRAPPRLGCPRLYTPESGQGLRRSWAQTVPGVGSGKCHPSLPHRPLTEHGEEATGVPLPASGHTATVQGQVGQGPAPRGLISCTGLSGGQPAARTLGPPPEQPLGVPYCPCVSGPQVCPSC